jgi:hypothetical protein
VAPPPVPAEGDSSAHAPVPVEELKVAVQPALEERMMWMPVAMAVTRADIARISGPDVPGGDAEKAEKDAIAIEAIQREFINEAGAEPPVGLNPDNPGDMARLRKWLDAQRRADDALRAQIGIEAFGRIIDLRAERQMGMAPGR